MDQCWVVLKMKDRYASIIRSGTHSLTHQFSKNSKKQIWYIATILNFFGEKVKELARKKIAGSLQKISWKLSNFKSFWNNWNQQFSDFEFSSKNWNQNWWFFENSKNCPTWVWTSFGCLGGYWRMNISASIGIGSLRREPYQPNIGIRWDNF